MKASDPCVHFLIEPCALSPSRLSTLATYPRAAIGLTSRRTPPYCIFTGPKARPTIRHLERATAPGYLPMNKSDHILAISTTCLLGIASLLVSGLRAAQWANGWVRR